MSNPMIDDEISTPRLDLFSLWILAEGAFQHSF